MARRPVFEEANTGGDEGKSGGKFADGRGMGRRVEKYTFVRGNGTSGSFTYISGGGGFKIAAQQGDFAIVVDP